MADVCFTSASITIVTGLLTALCACVGILFRALLASKDAQIADWRAIAERGTAQTGAALEIAKGRR